MTAAAVHGQMAMPKAVHRDEAAELAEQLLHAAYMDAAFGYARVLLADLADARRRYAARFNLGGFPRVPWSAPLGVAGGRPVLAPLGGLAARPQITHAVGDLCGIAGGD